MSHTKIIAVGNKIMGGGHDILIQSMLNVPAHDVEGNVHQAIALEKAGCDILRVAIPDMQSVSLIGAIKQKIQIPLVADIHFDYRL